MKQYITTSRYGTKKYFKDKEQTILHREDGPAVEYANGERAWYVDGKYHRTDDPAIEYPDGGKTWYINGVFIFEVDGSGQLIKRMQ